MSDCESADKTKELLEGWIEDYNTLAPHSGLGMKSPLEYRIGRQEKDNKGTYPPKNQIKIRHSPLIIKRQNMLFSSNK